MRDSLPKIRVFRQIIRGYYRAHKRDLPWRHTQNPYKILVSEMMLQQTQVPRVELYWGRFISRFPDFKNLARAPLRDVLTQWQGLGYNRRALYLKKTAQIILEKYGGKLPCNFQILITLPGIGNGTAGAILAFAHNKAEPFIETNIRRVFIHFFFPDKKAVDDKEIFSLIEASLDKKNSREWYYALMDYGAMLGKNRRLKNPNRLSRHYRVQGEFAGSRRELRGKIIRMLLCGLKFSAGNLHQKIHTDKKKLKNILAELEKEKILERKSGKITLAQ